MKKKATQDKPELDKDTKKDKATKADKRGKSTEEDAKSTKGRGKRGQSPKEEDKVASKSSKDDDKKKDPAKPQKVASDYNVFIKLFSNDVISKQKKPVENNERFKIIADAFKSITDEQKEKIAEWKKADEKRYQKQMKEYEKNGYYIMDDGR